MYLRLGGWAYGLQQMFAVEDVRWQCERINTVNTAQIDTEMIRDAGGFMKGVNAAAGAEIMFGGFAGKLIKAKSAVFGVNEKLVPRDDKRCHHGAFARAHGTIAAYAFGDGFGFK